jgi:hypothetical protein
MFRRLLDSTWVLAFFPLFACALAVLFVYYVLGIKFYNDRRV